MTVFPLTLYSYLLTHPHMTIIEVRQKGKVGYQEDMWLESVLLPRQVKYTWKFMLCYISLNIPGIQTNLLYMDPVLTGHTWVKKITWKTLLLPFFPLYTYLYASKSTLFAAKPEEINLAHRIDSQTTNILITVSPTKAQ